MVQATTEQLRAVEEFCTGANLALQAGAGTGKTTTLQLLARSRPGLRGRYIAFNRSIAHEAARKFPAGVSCRTAHSLAMAAIGHRYARRLDGPRVQSWKVGVELGLTVPITLGSRNLSVKALSYTTLRAVTRYCYSADLDIHEYHVPLPKGLDPVYLPELAEILTPFARRAWEDLQNPIEGVVPFGHDHYLKLWALTEPRLPADFLLLDEAQDTNPVVEKVFAAQGSHAQLVMVGDSAQAIYGWRGARDVMTGFPGRELALSHSFRFGPAIAAEANRWLDVVGVPLRLTGQPALNSTVGTVEQEPDAILCRTNGGAMAEVMRLLGDNRRVALVGGGKQLRDLAIAARDLKEGRAPLHPELMLFHSWGELQEYVQEDPAGSDLLPLVEVIDEYDVDAVLAAVDQLTDERFAQVAVSTAHKAKGREWDTVRIHGDFLPPPDEDDEGGQPFPGLIDEGEARLAYVAVTRARHHLDTGGLAWFDRHPQGRAADPAPPANGWPSGW